MLTIVPEIASTATCSTNGMSVSRQRTVAVIGTTFMMIWSGLLSPWFACTKLLMKTSIWKLLKRCGMKSRPVGTITQVVALLGLTTSYGAKMLVPTALLLWLLLVFTVLTGIRRIWIGLSIFINGSVKIYLTLLPAPSMIMWTVRRVSWVHFLFLITKVHSWVLLTNCIRSQEKSPIWKMLVRLPISLSVIAAW